MKRRSFITLLGGAAAAWPLVARAQPRARMRRIGVLLPATSDDAQYQAWFGAFLQALGQSGWTIGRNVQVDTRWATANADSVRRHATELAALAPDVIVSPGASTVGPLLQVTRAIPIVFAIVADPVGAGFVASLARPGGNATGFTTFEYGTSGKWLELLKEIAPGMTRVAVLRDAATPSGVALFGVIQAVASALRVETNPLDLRDAAEIERAVTAFADSSNSGLVITPHASSIIHRDLIVQLRPGTGCLPSTTNACSSLPEVSSHTDPIISTSFGGPRATSTASSRVRSQLTCRCKFQPSTSW
jgi:putative tryptophan/tyrosine transport system substrate-binding protein